MTKRIPEYPQRNWSSGIYWKFMPYNPAIKVSRSRFPTHLEYFLVRCVKQVQWRIDINDENGQISAQNFYRLFQCDDKGFEYVFDQENELPVFLTDRFLFLE